MVSWVRLHDGVAGRVRAMSNKGVEAVLANAEALRGRVGGDFHERLVEATYADAARIADRAVTRKGERGRFDLDRTIDRLVTSR